MWNLILSTIAFVIAAWYIRRYLDEYGIPKGMTRSLLVFLLAYMVSWGAGEMVDWAQGNTGKPASATQDKTDFSRQIKAAGLGQY